MDGAGVYARYYGGIFGALHAALDLNALDSRLLELLKVGDKAVVL